MKTKLILLFILLSFEASYSQKVIKADQASKFIRQKMTVCGKVVSFKYLSKSKGQPTLLNLDKPYPNQIFTVLIWGSDRFKFGQAPEQLFNGKDICVSGVIQDYKGKPEIMVNDPKQIQIGPK